MDFRENCPFKFDCVSWYFKMTTLKYGTMNLVQPSPKILKISPQWTSLAFQMRDKTLQEPLASPYNGNLSLCGRSRLWIWPRLWCGCKWFKHRDTARHLCAGSLPPPVWRRAGAKWIENSSLFPWVRPTLSRIFKVKKRAQFDEFKFYWKSGLFLCFRVACAWNCMVSMHGFRAWKLK